MYFKNIINRRNWTKNRIKANNKMKIFTGKVISKKMAKTATVEVERIVAHKLYKKRYKRTKKYHVHDKLEKNMIQLRSILTPADNSGAKRLMVIGVTPKIGKKATIGDVITCVVDGAAPAGMVADKEIVQVLIVRTRKEIRRSDGSYVRFDDNAGGVINKQGLPRGSRILGPIAREVKEVGYNKIASLAREGV